MTLGQKIRFARRSLALSQKQLGDMVQVSDKAVSAYEVDRAIPPLATLRLISRATSKPVSFFINEAQSEEAALDQKIASIQEELREIKYLLQKQFGE